MRLRFARLDERARLPTRARPGDAGLDLYAIEPAVLAPGERASIPTGLAVEIPDGHAGLLLARSGLASRHGVAIVNAPGLIDSGYRGELRVLLLNTDREHSFQIAPGERIAQLVVISVAQPTPLEVSDLTLSERGVGGLGSTGR
ncbi:MAG TPA: dUTP diphosphatase [Solirubrobacteraceae bacterium]|nr:dUTP diphosphatase [Solirubrobacteraceae bacterium]